MFGGNPTLFVAATIFKTLLLFEGWIPNSHTWWWYLCPHPMTCSPPKNPIFSPRSPPPNQLQIQTGGDWSVMVSTEGGVCEPWHLDTNPTRGDLPTSHDRVKTPHDMPQNPNNRSPPEFPPKAQNPHENEMVTSRAFRCHQRVTCADLGFFGDPFVRMDQKARADVDQGRPSDAERRQR